MNRQTTSESCFRRNITVNCWTWFCNTKTEDKNLDKIELNAVEHGYPHSGCFSDFIWVKPKMLLSTKLYSTLLWAHGLQHTSFLCPHYLAICSHSCPLIWWCYLSISSSATHFSGFSAMGFSRQERWSGFHFLLQGIFPTQGSNPCLLHWQADSLPRSHQGNPQTKYSHILFSRFGEGIEQADRILSRT